MGEKTKYTQRVLKHLSPFLTKNSQLSRFERDSNPRVKASAKIIGSLIKW